MQTCLIVEDDKKLSQGVRLALEQNGQELIPAYSLREARKIWETRNIDMVLLDVNLPDGSGYELLECIRKTSRIPVIMLTANDLEIDEVTGFRMGADDYITKPFSLMVLRARVERMRLRSLEGNVEVFEQEGYYFDFGQMHFTVMGEEIILSKTEQKLLKLFTSHLGQTLKREQLTERLWTDGEAYVDENALSVAMTRLRKKLGTKEGEQPIRTVYGLGYVWEKV